MTWPEWIQSCFSVTVFSGLWCVSEQFVACFLRLQIRTSCRRLCELLPFVSGHLDTATTLELTAKYMSYLKQTLPQDILNKVGLLYDFTCTESQTFAVVIFIICRFLFYFDAGS